MKKKVESFEDLIIWQKAIDLAKEIYIVTENQGIKTDFGLKGQMRRAVVAISSNIAEGFERRSRKEYLNFLNIAKASSGELRSQLRIALEIGYLEPHEYADLKEKSRFLSGSIWNHMKSISNASLGA